MDVRNSPQGYSQRQLITLFSVNLAVLVMQALAAADVCEPAMREYTITDTVSLLSSQNGLLEGCYKFRYGLIYVWC